MSQKASMVKVFKNGDSPKVLKETFALFSVFSKDVIELNKKIDKPDVYYLEGDEIKFTICLKNVGDKRVNNFSLKDELESVVVPFDNGYHVECSKGRIESYSNPVVINGITLNPGEETVVCITGIIGATEEPQN